MMKSVAAALVAATAFSAPALAQDIKVGLSGTFSGPNAANGIPYRNAAEVFPKTIAGTGVQWIVVDDATDPTTAVKNARRFVDEDKVDIILGSTSTVTASAMTDVAVEAKTAQIALSPIQIAPAKRPWVFNLPQPVPIMVSAIVEDLKKRKLKSIAFIGYADGWGDLNWNALTAEARKAGIEVTTGERYNRTDTSVTAQVLKVIASSPDAVLVGASGSAAALPQITLKDQGFTGPIYHTHGTVVKAFIDAAGKAGEGALMPTGPVVAAAELPDSNPIKPVSLDFISKYEAKWGKGSASPVAGYAWDAMLLVEAAAKEALKTAKPGTPEFRAALRDALQSGREVAGTNAVYRFTAEDHYGVDERARVLVVVKDGAFRLAK
ncbi:ABC transporter substrate-binding protein [Enterovirga aerilata]|uniref:ABC transporter substrate-binding protein n=1 Tax=Enterovirga aerilata TaxID=2730920 RepID=A0A849IG60_9HYPH|nr:ABC transporter substrate-binding protein [Enterovirga sp. DB1703]NNM75160.1 ABC transporter substrate-binding protein [Enterovirga sp. DB1703]